MLTCQLSKEVGSENLVRHPTTLVWICCLYIVTPKTIPINCAHLDISYWRILEAEEPKIWNAQWFEFFSATPYMHAQWRIQSPIQSPHLHNCWVCKATKGLARLSHHIHVCRRIKQHFSAHQAHEPCKLSECVFHVAMVGLANTCIGPGQVSRVSKGRPVSLRVECFVFPSACPWSRGWPTRTGSKWLNVAVCWQTTPTGGTRSCRKKIKVLSYSILKLT